MERGVKKSQKRCPGLAGNWIYIGVFHGCTCRRQALGKSAIGGRRSFSVILTNHFRSRYEQRVGAASPQGQHGWVKNSLARNKPKSIGGDFYAVKLIGAPFVVRLAREGDFWVALTVVSTTSSPHKEDWADEADYSSADEENFCDGPGTGNR